MARASDVFVQNRQPVQTYVSRNFVDPRTGELRDPELQIGEVLNRGGTIVQVIGPSKSGKTVAIKRRFDDANLVKIGGSQIVDQDRLWALVCADLKVQVSQKHSTDTKSGQTSSTEVSAKGSLYAAEFGLTKSGSRSKEKGTTREIEILDNLFELATNNLIAQGRVLFIDDFHVVPEAQKRLLAAGLKEASEKGVRICLAGVSHKAHELQDALPDLTGRVTRVDFDYWQEKDLRQIADRGFLALGLIVPDAVVSALVSEAGGSPQLMQLLCLELCNRFGIAGSRNSPQSLNASLQDLTVVCINTLSSISRESAVLTLERGSTQDRSKRRRWKAKAMGHADLYETCVGAISLNPPRSSIPLDAGADCIITRVQRIIVEDHDQISVKDITDVLTDMANTALSLSPSLPYLYFDVLRGVTVPDPYFLFYIRWCPKYFSLHVEA